MIKVMIADDHTIFRHGLKKILEENKDIEVVSEASNGNEAFDKAIKTECDIMLLDISMPGLTGLELLKMLKTYKPKLRVLILSMYPEHQYALRALKAGAAGYIHKASPAEELVEAIKRVYSDGKYISPEIAERFVFEFEPHSDRQPHELLTNREYQILCMIASGKTVSMIADELNLSVKTISTHRVHILEKMGMKNNAELTHYMIKNGLVEP